MITYVNSVFVSGVSSSNVVTVSTAGDFSGVTDGKFAFIDIDTATSVSANTVRFKIGMGTANGIKWSNIINVADIKGWAAHTNGGDTEDTSYISFSGASSLISNTLSKGGKRVIVRLTFKDLPTRYRKWTESYEYVTNSGDDANAIATGIANQISSQTKRARVNVTVGSVLNTAADGYSADDSDIAIKTGLVFRPGTSGTGIRIVAMPYDDDNSVDSLNWANKVRFNVNMYYTDPDAEGWESLNKHYITGATIDKVPGKTDPCSAKLVRDREAQGMGYLGILNRGEGTWPIVKPGMRTDLSKTYNSVTIEFENMYRTADDLFRKTKLTVEIYTTAQTSTITNVLSTLVNTVVDKNI